MKVSAYSIFVFLLEILLANSKKLSGRIISGKLAVLGQFPWFVSLKLKDDFMCGGSLISPKWVLTAAHCINSNQVICYFGSIERWHGLHMISRNIIVHPNFVKNEYMVEKDMALIKLPRKIYFSHNIKPISLAKEWMTYRNLLNQVLILAGIGRSNDEEYPARLRYTRMKVIPPQSCGFETIDPPQMKICAKAIKSYLGKNSCGGDSGSGLIYAYRGKFYAVGVVSYSLLECEDIDKTTVFQSVQMNLDWIKSITRIY